MPEQRSMTQTAVPPQIRAALEDLIARFGDNLRAVLWYGSRARGEAQSGSDEDLMLLFRTVDESVLLGLRETFLEAGRKRWSTYIVSDAEFRQLPVDRRLYFAHAFQTLHGDFEPLRLSQDDVLAYLRSKAREVLYQCRDRLINKERALPTVHRMAKYAVFLMKARHLYEHGYYPLTRTELSPLVNERDDRQIIEWVEGWDEVRPQFEKDPIPLILQLDAFARRLLDSLPPVEVEA
jgi:predicted nucleotidyltransferase